MRIYTVFLVYSQQTEKTENNRNYQIDVHVFKLWKREVLNWSKTAEKSDFLINLLKCFVKIFSSATYEKVKRISIYLLKKEEEKSFSFFTVFLWYTKIYLQLPPYRLDAATTSDLAMSNLVGWKIK